jgi:DNA adenine methylase
VFLNDSNAWLTSTYKAIGSNVNGVITLLKAHEISYRERGTDHYYEVRKRAPTLIIDVAADFIFLNKTCFNGLFRVNRAGDFNVPAGKFKSPPTICDEENLCAASRALQGVTITSDDFEVACRDAEAGDFVYFDPPYWPVSTTSNFTAYGKDPFGPNSQWRLRELALRLKKRGVKVLLSNADVPEVHDLYAGFNIERVEARRSINSKGGKRGAVGEVLIT